MERRDRRGHGSSVSAYQSSSVPAGSNCSSISQTRTCTNGTLSGSYTYGSCTVNQPALPTCSVWADANPIAYGANTTLRWTSSNANTSFYINNVGYVTPNTTGAATVGPLATRNYNGTATGPGGTTNCNFRLNVSPPPPSGLSASCNVAGNQVALSWNPASGAGYYGPRVYPLNTSTCPSGWQIWSGDGATCYPNPDAWYSTSVSNFPVTPNTAYSWWVHSASASGGWSGATSGSFTCTPTLPTCALSVAPSSINQGQTSTLSWSSTNATSCTGTNFSTGGAVSGNVPVSPSQPTTYTASCSNPAGSAQCTGTGSGGIGAALTVSCAQSWSCTGAGNQTITQTNTDCTTQNLTTCIAPQFCSVGGSVCLDPTPVEPTFIASGSLTGHLQALPTIVQTNKSSRLYWNVSDVMSCSVTGNGQTWNGLTSGSTGVSTGAIAIAKTFTLTCLQYPDGSSSFSEQKTVRVAPIFRER